MTVRFTNAAVFTGRGERDRADGFRVEDGVVTALGDGPAAPGEEIVDLSGRTVLPGFLDLHTHPALMSVNAGTADLLPPAVVSLAGLVTTLSEHAAWTDSWIVGTGYDDAVYPEGRGPDRRDLDAVSADRPVLVHRCDGHSGAANSRALALAGITAATPDPPGARFERDAAGEPTGVLTEIRAVRAVSDLVPGPDLAVRARRLADLDAHFLSHGITGVCDLLSTILPEPLATFRAARELGFRPRAALYPGWSADLPDLEPGDREGPVRVAGTKVLIDGAFSNRTAWVDEPYPDSHDHGLRALSDEDLLAAAAWARRNGVQLAVHAMGDRALGRVVDLLGDQRPWLDAVPSVRLEHATLVPPALLERLRTARVRFGIATHSIFFFAETAAYHRNLQPQQAPYPLRSLYDSGLPLALSSDRPATAWHDADDVLTSVGAAVSRVAHDGSGFGRRESLTVEQALLLYTGRARTLVDLGPVGVLEPGSAADFVVLDADVLTVPEDRIAAVRIAETWLAGTRVFTSRSGGPSPG